METKSDQPGDNESINSESDDAGEAADNDTSQQTASNPPALEPENSDRTEDCNFLAMLQLAPVDAVPAQMVSSESRSATASPTPETKQTTGSANSKSQAKPGKSTTRVTAPKTDNDEPVAGNRNSVSNNEVVAKRIYLATVI